MAVLRDTQDSREFPVRGKVTLIGRDPACDIVVTSQAASARHAMIVQAGGDYFIEDLDSLNGTYVNRKRIRRRTRLQAGDQVEILGLSATFNDESAPPASSGQDTVHFELPPEVKSSAPILSSFEISSDLRLAVKPEAKLRAVLEIARNLGGTLDLKTVLPKALESLLTIFPQADCGFVLLFDAMSGQLVPRAVRHRREPANNSVPLSKGIIDHVLRTGRAVLSADAGADARFDATQSISHLKIRSIMCVPMLSQSGNCLGIIQIDARDRKNQFQQEDLDLLACASVQAARTVELAQLHEERRDLEAATRIQKSFLPAERPKDERLRFFDHYLPAMHVGGDYFDYVPLPGGRLAVALGDVSGKGISAALLMARLSAAVRFSLATTPTLAEAVREVNRSFLHSSSEERFVTFVAAVLNAERTQVTLVNAGHPPPLLRRTGESPRIVGDEVVGLPLAVMDRPYQEMVVPIQPGDTLVLYTDGVSEARSPTNDLYGIERLQQAVQSAPDDVEALGKAVLADIKRFAAGRPPNDDLTLVCVSRRS